MKNHHTYKLAYTKELQQLFPHYDVIDYNGKKDKKSTHFCDKHQLTFEAVPWTLLRTTLTSRAKNHCPQCRLDKLTTNYKEELIELNLNVKVEEDYIDRRTKIKHICPQCNGDWLIAPKHVITKSKDKVKCAKCVYSEFSITTQEDKYKNKETKLYYVEVNKGVYKLGLTQASVKHRYRMDKEVLITPIREWVLQMV